MGDNDLVSEVREMKSTAGGKEVRVWVMGPKLMPNAVKEMRARARALVAAGVLPSTRERVQDITMGELKRYTSKKSGPRKITTKGKFFEGVEYTIMVNE